MSPTPDPSAWRADIQARLMAAIDAAWALAEHSDDPAVIAKAREKAKLCGQIAATARKVAAMTPAERPGKAGSGRPLDLIADFVRDMEAATTAPAEPPPEPRAAQAVAMRAALAKLKRR